MTFRLARLVSLLFVLVAPVLPVFAATDERTITNIGTISRNQFDNAGGGTIDLNVDVSGGAVANDAPDAQGGYRIEVYNSNQELVRRLAAGEINSDPTTNRQFNGRDDSAVLLPYGSYQARAYTSMNDPKFVLAIQGSGITIDRPGDMHVSSSGVLTWINTGNRLSFCQASLGDPNVEQPTFLKLVDLPTGVGSATTNGAYGITANSAGDVYLTDNFGAADQARILKFIASTDTWSNPYGWATTDLGGFSTGEDEWYGLGIDNQDSIYYAGATAIDGGGEAGGAEQVRRLSDTSTRANSITASPDLTVDLHDVSPYPSGRSLVYAWDYANRRIYVLNNNLTANNSNLADLGGGTGRGSIWVTRDTFIYVADEGSDRFVKLNSSGGTVYSLAPGTDGLLDAPNGIAVWMKDSTKETFIIVGSQGKNAIYIYKETPAGDSATLVRTIADDPKNLLTPEGIAVSADSGIYVISRGQKAIKRFTINGEPLALTGTPNGQYIQGVDATSDVSDSSGFNTPRAIAVDDTGNIYVFDHNRMTTPVAHCVIKKFDPDGRPLGVIQRMQTLNSGFDRHVVSAVWRNNSLYASTTDGRAKVIRFNSNGAALQHLGNQDLGGSAPEGNPAFADALGLYVGPFYDKGQPAYIPDAVYMLGDNERIEVWRSDFSGGAKLIEVDPATPAISALGSFVAGFLIDEFGEAYVFNGNSREFGKWHGGTQDDDFAKDGVLQYTFASGTGDGQFRDPRQMIWTDNRGIYKANPAKTHPTTGRLIYDRELWVVDQTNNRLQKLVLEWEDVRETPIIMAKGEDTPTIVSASISGVSESIATIGGITYVARHDTGITIQLNFAVNVSAGAGMEADTPPVVEILPSGGVYTTVAQSNYVDGGTTWVGTVPITASMNDGQAEIRIAGAHDNRPGEGVVASPPSLQRTLQSPDPDQTDFDPGDDFKHFVIDKTPPIFSLTTPPSGGASTTEAQYTVSGTVTSEATGLDATLLIQIWTDSVSGILFDQASVTASASTGNFSGLVNLRGPAPTDNWVTVTAIDKIKNRSAPLARILVRREKNVGSAYIDPASEIQVGTLRRYEIRYTAQQTLSGDTIRLTVPALWNAPQKGAPTTNGYTTHSTDGSYTDSVFAGQTIDIRGLSLGVGGRFSLFYGDSISSLNGRGGPDVNDPLDDASNTFKVELMQSGETMFTTVPPASGKSLFVPVRDSSLAVAVLDTGPGTAFNPPRVEIAKGDETRVMRVRAWNSNLGNHINKINQVSINVQTDTGGPANWNQVASKVVIKNTAELTTFGELTALPGSSGATLNLTNFTITQGAFRDFEVWVTMSPTASYDTVQFFISGASSFIAVDSASNKTISVVERDTGVAGASNKTGEYDIIGLAPADTLSIGTDTAFTPFEVATGQLDVAVMDLFLKNDPAIDAPTNSIRVDKIVLSIRDVNGAGLIPGRVIKSIKIRDVATNNLLGGVDTPSIPSNGDTIAVTVSGLTVASGVTKQARVYVSIVDDSPVTSNSRFRVRFSDTPSITAKDQVTQLTVKVRDDPARAENLPFQTDSILIMRRAKGTLKYLQPLRTDSSQIRGEMGDIVVTGDVFFVAMRWKAEPSRSALRVEPSDSDFYLYIDGVNRSSEFTVTAPAARNVGADQEDTFQYQVVQNLGSSAGVLTIAMADTTIDTRPALFDQHDFNEPDKLRAELTMTPPHDTFTISTAPLIVSVFSLGTSYANPGEDSVPILRFQVQNNQPSVRNLDSVVVEAISAGAAVDAVHLYWDNRNGVLDSGTVDTLVASGTLNANDTVLLMLSPEVVIAGSGGRETFFVVFGFANAQTDGDTFDARIPSLGVRVHSENNVPNGSINSSGEGLIEVFATRLTVTPDTQIVAVAASPQITLQAVDQFGNLDNVVNLETAQQGHNVQVTVTLSDSKPNRIDTGFAITATSGMTSVTPTPGVGVSEINGRLTGGQGTVTFTDTRAETVAITLASILTDSTGRAQFANLITATASNLPQTDSARYDSRAVVVAAFRVTNQGGAADAIRSITIKSLNSNDAHIKAVMLFRDTTANSNLDSGADRTLGTGNFSSGRVTFTFSDTIANGDSALYFVAYDIMTSVTDGAVIDAQIDTLIVQSSGNNLSNAMNSTPLRYIEVVANKIVFSPKTGATGVLLNLTVTVSAQDAAGNTDKDYTGGATKLALDLSGSAYYVSSTFANQEHPVSGDASRIKGNLVNGTADVTFTDATPETTTMIVTASPGITGTNDTGSYTFTQGFSVTALALSNFNVAPNDTNRVLLSFKVSASGTSDSVIQVNVTWVGTNDADVTNLRLYRDIDANDVFSASVDAQVASGTFAADDTVTFQLTDTVYVASGTDRTLFFVLDVASGAVNGDTLDAELRVGSIKTQGNIAGVPAATRNSSGLETVAIPNFTLSALSIPDSQAVPGETGLVVGRFELRNGSTLTTDTVTRMIVRNRGTVRNGDVLSVEAWIDQDADGVFDTGTDFKYGSATSFDASESATFDSSFVFAALETRTLFIVYAIKSTTTAVDGDTIDCDFDIDSITTLGFTGNVPAAVTNSPDSVRLVIAAPPPAGDLFADSLAMASGNFPSGAKDVLIGSFEVRSTRTSQDTLTSVTFWNDTGAHPDTGLDNVRVYIDVNKNGIYNSGTDLLFGSASTFTNRKLVRSGTRNIPASDTIGVLIVVDLSPTLTVDSQFLRARVDTNGFATIFPDSAGVKELRSPGSVRTRVLLASGESVTISGGAGVVGESIAVSVSVFDTGGIPAQQRNVQLFAPGGLSILTTNPVLTDTKGIVLFWVRSFTAAVYNCTVSIDASIYPSEIGYVNVLSTMAAFDTGFTNNTSRSTNTGAVRKYSSPLSFSTITADRAAELRYRDQDYSIYYDHVSAPTLLWNVNSYTNFSLTNPGPSYTSSARVRKIKGVAGDVVVFGGFSSTANFGANLYYKPWGAAAGDPPTRISPNDTRSGVNNRAFDTDAQFDQFDVSPAEDEVVFAFDGNLARFAATGATFNPTADSPTLQFYTTFKGSNGNLIGGYQQPGPHAHYPSFSPDGTRIAFTVIHRNNGWSPSATPGSDSAEIWVLKNIAGITRGSFPFATFSSVDTLPDATNAHLVRITRPANLRFAWQPQWSRDGSVIFFSANNNLNFNYDKFSQAEDPQLALNGAGVDFNTYMIYYDKANETAPYAPILMQHEPGISELAGEMSFGGTRMGYMRAASTAYYEERTVDITNQASITTSGGILFDSGRVVVVVGQNDGYGTGFRISVMKPDSSPAGTESVVISGLAKRFFNPDTPTSPVYFGDSVRIILYYTANHFSDTDRTGFDSDGDGIPDRTEAAVSAYYWNGASWVEYPTVRHTSDNKIEFYTDHFSLYGAGIPMNVHALAFGGSVQDIVVYPNPWRSDGPTGSFSTSDERYGIKMTNMPGADVRVKIYTIAGELVLDGTVNALTRASNNPSLRVTQTIINTNASGTVSWNLGNQSGRHIASGVYLVMLEGPGGRVVRKVAVIR